MNNHDGRAPRRVLWLLGSTAALVAPSVAFSQAPPADDAPPAAPAAPGGAPPVTIVQVPPAAPTYPGTLPSPGFNPDSHLGQGSRSTTDTSHSTDGFDFGGGTAGPSSVHGSSNGQFVTEGAFTPDFHTVRRGDTLWDLSSRYYNNPYYWPRIWSFNAQIQNPHWIYPGDRVRLRDGSVASTASRLQLGGQRRVPPGTVFLRDMGWIDDVRNDAWGDLVGSPSDHMLLGTEDEVYIQLHDDHEVTLGTELTIFLPIHPVTLSDPGPSGSPNEERRTRFRGELVNIRGTVKVDRYNPKTKMARAKVIEALDVIERGAKIGPVTRRFDVVPPIKSDVDVDANIIASTYPYHFYGQNQVVFLDRGEEDGVRVGMRFFAVMRGDRWVQSTPTIGQVGLLRARVQDDRPARVDAVDPEEFRAIEDLLPDETYAEFRVMRVRPHTAAAIVVHAKHEIERNAHLISRKGF